MRTDTVYKVYIRRSGTTSVIPTTLVFVVRIPCSLPASACSDVFEKPDADSISPQEE